MKLKFAISVILLSAISIKAQLVGSYSVPGNFTSVAHAVDSLNIAGVVGSVTINVLAGHTETVPVGGIILNPVSGSSTLNTVTFQKSGVGTNPILYAYSGGTANSTSAKQDGIWALVGADNITVDGINLQDLNTTIGATMEYGFGFFKNNAIDGCWNNMIKNCTITLNRSFAVLGAYPSESGSRGINCVNSMLTSQTTSITVALPSGSHSNNKFYSNTILNTNVGIALHGFNQLASSVYVDRNNDVGGSGSGTGNNILNYGGGSTSVTAVGIAASAQYDFNSSFNTLDNNIGTGAHHANSLKGIYIYNSDGANLTVSSNSIGLTCIASNNSLSLIETKSGTSATTNTITISDNLLSGSGFTTSSSSSFYGIRNTSDAGRLIISNNTFTNNSLNLISGYANLIGNTSANTTSVTITNNTLTMSFNSAFSGSFYGILNSSTGITKAVDISNNFIENIKHVSTGSGSCFLLRNTADYTEDLIMNGNIFNNLNIKSSGAIYLLTQSGIVSNSLSVSSNSITGAYTRTTSTGGVLSCISIGGSSAGTCTHTVAYNNFSNISVPSGTSGAFSGIVDYSGNDLPFAAKYIFGNVISNVNFVGTSGTSQLLRGGYMGNGYNGAPSAIYSNTLSNISVKEDLIGLDLSGSFSGGAFSLYSNYVYSLTSTNGDAIGLNMSSNSVGANIYKNKIVSISAGPSGIAIGMKFQSSTSVLVYNNIVGHVLGSATSVSSGNGIQILSGTSYSLYNNSVYLTGAGPSGYGSNAIYVSSTPTVELVNNIFVNVSSPSGSGVHCAMRRSSNSYTTYSSNSNNNLYYAGSPGTYRLIHHNGSNAYQTLSSYKAISSGLEIHSVTENAPFANFTPSLSTYLTIFPSFGTQIESGAQYLNLVNDDFAGTTRVPASTDIGAFEGNYTPPASDLFPPNISGYGFANNACNLAQRIVTVQISDPYIVASGTLSPKVYYKVNSGTYTSTPGNLISGNVLNGVWSFTLNYTSLPGDVVSFFTVAQDVVANAIAAPAIGASVTAVNSVISPPTSPNTFTVGMTLNGIYSVGSSGSFTSISQAANAYNTGCLTGPVTFSLTNTLYSANETFPIVFLNNPTASSTNSLLLLPASGSNVVVQPSSTTAAVFKFHKSQHITIDGFNGSGSDLTLNYTYTNTSAGIWLTNDYPSPDLGSSYIKIHNTKITGPGVTGLFYGIICSAEAAVPSTGNGGAGKSDNISINSNTLTGVYYGISTIGTWYYDGLNKNWTITNNLVGPAVSGIASTRVHGIFASYMSTLSITGNTIQNTNTSIQAPHGISLASYVDNFTVGNNLISSLTTSTSGFGNSVISGIFLGSGVKKGKIYRNVIDNILSNASYGYVRGINIATGEANSDMQIHNNFISNLKGAGGVSSEENWTHGISIEQGSGNIDIDFNTIVLSGFFPGTPSVTGSSAIFTYSTPSTPNFPKTWNIRNNILVNTYDNFFSSVDVNYLIYSSVPLTEFNSISNNCYYADGTGLNTVYGFFGANYPSYQSFMSLLGSNNSKNLLPVFQSTNDLHIVQTNTVNALLDNGGTSVAGIIDDIDGNVRALLPDIGADEFTSTAVCSGAIGGTLSLSTATICSTQSLSISSESVSAGIGSTYQWKYSQTSGSSYTNLTVGAGTNSASLNATLPNSGVYYLVLEAACNSSLISISNEATITVLATAAPTVIANPSVICASGSATLTASGANSYTWSNGSTGSVVIIPNNAQGNYYVFATNSNSCPTVLSNSVNINYGTSNLSASSTPSLVCPGNSATVSASGANTYTWTGFSPSQTLAITPTVTTIYTVNGVDSQGCIGSATVEVNIASLPTLVVSGNTAVCAGLTATMVASGANSYTWVNSGNTLANNSDVPTANTVYTVIGQSINGCVAEKTFTVTLTNTLTLLVSGSTTLCSGASLSHTASGGASNYIWTTPQGTFNTAVINTSPSSSTIYTLSGNTPSCSGSVSFAITVFTPSISVNGNMPVCLGNSLTLNASGVSSYTWVPSGINSASLSFTPSGNTVYTVYGHDVNNCSANQTVAIVTNSLPLILISPSSGTTCIQSPITLNASGASSYTWSSGGGNNSSASFTPIVNTTYTVTGTDTFNGCINSKTVDVIVSSLPTIAISGSTVLCAGNSVTLNASGAVSYSWSNGSFGNSTVVSPSISTSYNVFGTNTAGCISNASVTIVSNALPSISIASTTTTICTSSPISFTVSGASTYTWSNFANTTTITITPTANAIYTVNGTSVNGCTSSQTIAITTLSLPIILTTPNTATTCIQGSASFTAAGAGSFTWSSGGGNSAIANFTPITNTSYTVTGTDAMNGCVTSKTVSVITNSLPILNISGNSVICTGQTATLSAIGATNYSWSTGALNSSVVVSPSVNTTYILTGTNALGCSSSTNFAVVSNSVPVISISQSSTIVCVSSLVSFTAGGANSYTWSTSSNGATLSVNPTTNTVYSVSGTNSSGCNSTQTVAIATLSLPVIVVNPSSASVCAQNPISFTASGATNYTWSNTGGNLASASYTPSSNSVYTVTGIDGVSNCVNTKTVSVTTYSLPVLSLSGSTVLCAGESTTLNISGASTYSWSTGSSSSSLIMAPSTSTIFNVTGLNSNNCQSSTTVSITVNPLPILSVSGVTLVCPGNSTTLTVSGADSYLWSNGSTSATTVISPTVNTTYSVTGTDVNGCSALSTYTINTALAPTITVNGSNVICSGSSSTLSALGANNYTWSTAAVTSSILVSPLTSSVYVVTGTSSSSQIPCPASLQVTITVNSLPNVQINASKSSICYGDQITLSGTGAQNYQWTGGVINGTPFTPSSTSAYTVTGTSSNGCTNSGTITIPVNPLPVVTATSSKDTLCEGDELILSAFGATNYLWSGGQTGNSTLVTPGLNDTIYSVVGSDLNNCSASFSLNLFIAVCTSLQEQFPVTDSHVYPNPFSSWFIVEAPGDISNQRIEVYDNIGRLVFSETQDSNKYKVDMKYFANGLYYIHIVRKGNTVKVALLIKH